MSTTLYGRNWPDTWSRLEIELTCFKGNWSEGGGLGAYRHLKNAINLIYRDAKGNQTIRWNEWLAWGLKSLCEHKVNAWTGCAAAGKTYLAGLFGIGFWLAAPAKTSVILTSTTGKMVRKRIWPVIQELYQMAPGLPGNMVDSKTTLQSQRGDDKHGLFAMAVKDGPSEKAVANIQGLHSPRMLLVVDEGTDVPEAIMEAIPNLQKACDDFRILIIGNASSRMDPHGRACEPAEGWNSIGVEDDDWETKGVPEWGLDPGICLHFDGTKSPNIKAGEDKWPFLYTLRDYKRDTAKPESSETIGFWKFTRGFWAPEGMCKTVMSEPLIYRCDGLGKFTFHMMTRKIAGLDPAFGGDACKLKIGTLGDLEDGRTAVQLEKTFEIPVKASRKEDAHFQIARRVREICESENVTPDCFGLDATGEGGGLASIMTREWSESINWVEFGGSPSDYPVGEDDKRPCRDVYDRKVTELWFTAREFLINGQLKGLNQDDVRQFCSREYSDDRRKIKLDTKEDCKKKIGRSPDDADAVVVLLDVAKRLGTSPGGGQRNGPRVNWLAIARERNSINDNDDEHNAVGVTESSDWADQFELGSI